MDAALIWSFIGLLTLTVISFSAGVLHGQIKESELNKEACLQLKRDLINEQHKNAGLLPIDFKN